MNADELALRAREWVVKAEHDLATAQEAFRIEEDRPYDTIAYLAQQCAEKYLKALLVSRGIDFPRTHDLTVLATMPGSRSTRATSRSSAGMPSRRDTPATGSRSWTTTLGKAWTRH